MEIVLSSLSGRQRWVSLAELLVGAGIVIGLRRPGSWWKTVAWALAAALPMVALSDLAVGPIAEKHLGAPHASKATDSSSPSLG